MTDPRTGPYVYDKIEEIRGQDEAESTVLFLLAIVDNVFALLEYAHVDDMRYLADQTNQHWVADVRDWLDELEKMRTKYDLQELKI